MREEAKELARASSEDSAGIEEFIEVGAFIPQTLNR